MRQFGLGVLKVSPQPLSRLIVAYSGDTQKSPQVNCVCTGAHSVWNLLKDDSIAFEKLDRIWIQLTQVH
jgi:hypothetical protein